MENVKPLSNAWLYQGAISKIAVAVDPAPKSSGGYVIALSLSNGTTRLAASRDPARYVAQLLNTIRSLGGDLEVSQAFISHYHPRYEPIKRWIGQELMEHKVGPDAYSVPINIVSRKLTEAVAAADGKIAP